MLCASQDPCRAGISMDVATGLPQGGQYARTLLGRHDRIIALQASLNGVGLVL